MEGNRPSKELLYRLRMTAGSKTKPSMQRDGLAVADELVEAHRWIASLMTHMEDNWRAIDDGPIARAREYLLRTGVLT